MENTKAAIDEPGGQSEQLAADPLDLFVAYPFSTDTMYQQGLSGILGTGALDGKSDDEKKDVLLRSQVFYFNRITGYSIAVDNARTRWEQIAQLGLHPPAIADPSAMTHGQSNMDNNGETRTLTFVELKELIEQGKTDQIPNNRSIPNELNSAMPSESRANLRKKPWEIDAQKT
ncbi:hypothetical protein SCP_0506700 [Sparassis crispa]|uniref:Uncharacterized protein n=1 Tax=Sparassis crispa TaxID=139825 RepID=A0A401GN23_9APHY|nr:hypothetical protein SCP_0506700 [Sparassis crispa]GBE83615.1 hypothetical protein SCP_0506700 [Sparassis crispa]